MSGEVINAKQWASIASPEDVVYGVDEAGRGSWAGPIVVGVMEFRPADYTWTPMLRDSKKMKPSERWAAVKKINDCNVRYDIGEVDNRAIDKENIDIATAYAFIWACARLWVPSSRHCRIVMDGKPSNWHPAVHDWLEKHFDRWYFMPKADDTVPSVSGASILAKVHHDAVMDEEAEEDGNKWGFRENKGYGTEEHRQALYRNNSPSPMHRMTFMPMKGIWDG